MMDNLDSLPTNNINLDKNSPFYIFNLFLEHLDSLNLLTISLSYQFSKKNSFVFYTDGSFNRHKWVSLGLPMLVNWIQTH